MSKVWRVTLGLGLVFVLVLLAALLFAARPHGTASTRALALDGGEEPPRPNQVAVAEANHPMVATWQLDVHVTAGGTNVEGARVTAFALTSRWEGRGERTTDAQGRVRLEVHNGGWLLSVSKEGFASAQVELVIDGSPAPIEIVLSLGGHLHGFAIDEQNVRVAPAVIRAIPLGDRVLRSQNSSEGGVECATDARGEFHFERLNEGWWRIEGTSEGFGVAEPEIVSLPSSTEVTLRFRRSGFIDGVVLHADGGVAGGAHVSLVGFDSTEEFEAGPTGTFSTELSPGSYRVSARFGREVGTAEHPVLVRSKSTISTRIVLAGGGGTIHGRITSDDGAPVAGAKVGLSPHNEAGTVAQGTTGTDGRYVLTSLARGSYDVRATATGYQSATAQGFNVLEGSKREVNLQLPRLGRIVGVVEDENGAPVEAFVALMSEAASLRQTRSARDGKFEFDAVVPGTVSLTARQNADEHPRATDAVVKAGTTTNILLRVSATIEVTVELDRKRCTDPSVAVLLQVGEPYSGIKNSQLTIPAGVKSVTLKLASETEVVTQSGQTANANIKLVPSGRVRGQATLPAGQSRGWVSLQGINSTHRQETEVRPDGSFEFEPVVPARYSVRLHCNACASIAPQSVSVLQGVKATVTLR